MADAHMTHGSTVTYSVASLSRSAAVRWVSAGVVLSWARDVLVSGRDRFVVVRRLYCDIGSISLLQPLASAPALVPVVPVVVGGRTL